MPEKVIFEKGSPGRRGFIIPALDVPAARTREILGEEYLRTKPPDLPSVSEGEVVRHYTRLSQENYCVDSGFYPLGSCTMKYNPKVNEVVAGLPGFASLHPLEPEDLSQGALQLMHELGLALCELGGVDRVSLQPSAGAQGELVGMLIIKAHHDRRGAPRKKVLIPDSAHGTNPASAALAGFEVQVVRSNDAGLVDLDDLKRVADESCAALMLTNPNTLGLFEKDILTIAGIVHDAGGLLYLDGANLNPLLGLCRPGDMGFDIVHFNLHKTFSTPHGGGGPGAGPVGVKTPLAGFLPVPLVEERNGQFVLDDNRPDSIGRVHAFYGNFAILVRAYAYIRRMGAQGLTEVGQGSILNANYLRKKLEAVYPIPYNRPCMHEFVLSVKKFREKGIHAWDVAKRLIDYGVYPPTVNFPLIVEEALMIEPTETEPKETLDAFCEALTSIAREAEEHPELVKGAPHTHPASRMDEVLAARSLNLRWTRT